MKKLFLLFFIFTTVLYAEVTTIPLDKAKIIADRNAATLWENVNPGEPIIYNDIDDNIVAYRFNYAINTQFPVKQTLIHECNQGEIAGNRKAQWGNGNYGNILMSARTDMPVNLEHGLGISSEYAFGAYMQEQAEKHLGSTYNLKRIYYVNGANVWYHYTNGTKDIYVKPHPPAKVSNEQEFRTIVDEFNFFCETGNYESEWDDYLYRQRTMSRTEFFVTLYDECIPFYDWSYGCSPTAAAMLLAYWDNMSLHGGESYSKLVDYHFARYDQVETEIDTHVPNLQGELAVAMDTDLETGSTSVADIAPGIEIVANDYNDYNFSVTYGSGPGVVCFAGVMFEINSNRPIQLGVEGHSICGVGYDDVDFEVATHYTHEPWIRWVSAGLLLRTYTVVPGGAYGLGIDVYRPDGDQDYLGGGSGETLYSSDIYHILWDHEPSANSYVRIDYNLYNGNAETWTIITDNTDNDGEYHWLIPPGLDSDECRIRIIVYSPGNTYWGSDGSYGNFEIIPGDPPTTLLNNHIYSAQSDPDYYELLHEYSTWCAVGIRQNIPTEDWNLKMYNDYNFTYEIEASTSSSSIYKVDFIVIDGHHSGTEFRGIKVDRVSGIYSGSVEYSGPSQSINIGSDTYIWTEHSVVEMYDIYLSPGTYSFGLDILSGTADLDIALFGGGSMYIAAREDNLDFSINAGAGVDEQFTYTITNGGYYGICVWANDVNNAIYELFIVQPGIWTGLVSTEWNNAANWSGFLIPDASINVTIPSGTPYQPTIGTGIFAEIAYCKDLTIQAGAVLTQTGTETWGSFFHVNGNFNSDAGTFTQNSDYAYLYFDGSDLYSWWDDDNEDDTYTMVRVNKIATTILAMWQDMTVKDFEIREGEFKIDMTWTLTVTGDLSSAFQVEDGGILTLQDETIDILNGDIEFEDGSQANVSGGLIRCGEEFRVLANSTYDIQFTGGTVEMIGSSTQYIQDLDGNTELYNLSINKSAGTCFVHVGDLLLNNNLTIYNGTLNSNIYDIYVGGHWTNHVGADGFIEGTGTVIFDGADQAGIRADETFYNLTEDKTSLLYNGLQLNEGFTATIINDLNINDGMFELDTNSTLIVGNDVFIASGSGLNAYGETGLEIFVGGDWTNDNTYWDTVLGYSPGTEVITFNGSSDQFITTQAPQEDFGYMVIDKTGGEFRPNDNIHVMNDFDILAGGWHDNTVSLTHYFEGDFYIAAGAVGYWNSTTGNSVVFTGINDQTIFNTIGVGYFCNVIIDKTEWPTRSFSNNESIESKFINQDNINQTDGITETRNMVVTLTSDIDMQFGNGLTIEEGTLDLNGMSLNSMGDVIVYLGGTLVVDEGAVLNVSNGNELTVFNGGVLEVLGTPGNLATISHRIFGNYDFNIYPGGKIKAEYGLFEYMTANGVYVWEDGIIDRTHSFNYCTFQNGFVGYGTLLYINNDDDVIITCANFPDDSSSDYNVSKTYDQGTISMITATGIFAGYDNELDLHNRIDWDGLPAIDDLTIHFNIVDNTIALNWTYPFPVDQYNIYRSTDPYEFLGSEVFISYTESYSEPVTGINYFYRVTAENISDND